MFKSFRSKTMALLSRARRGYPRCLNREMLDVIRGVVEWEVDAASCRRDAEEKAAWAEAFDDHALKTKKP
jgi:hypothetical protein